MRAPWEYRGRVDRSLPIERRILNAVIYVVHVRGSKPKAIYLTPDDMAQLKLVRHRSEIDGIPVRIGKVSKLYGDCWVVGRAI